MRIVIRHVLVVFHEPKPVNQLIRLVYAILAAMNGNVRFTSPDPALTLLLAAVQALEQAVTAAKARTVGTGEVVRERRAALMLLVWQLVRYVQRIADGNAAEAVAIIQSAGMKAKRVGIHTREELEAKNGKLPGEVILTARGAGSRASHDWQWGTDEKTWTSVDSTLKAKTVLRNLPLGVVCFFRHRVVTKTGVGPWSQVVSLMVK